MRKEEKNRYGLVLAAMIAAVSMTACGGQKAEEGTVSVQTEAHDASETAQMPETETDSDGQQTTGETSGDAAEQEKPIGMPNPYTDHATLEEAEKEAGFLIQVPDKIQGVAASAFRNLSQELLEVIYYEQGEQEVARVRKGTGKEDISGDYVNYPEAKTENVNGKSVTMKGQDGKVVLAIWNEGGYSYSVSVEGAICVDEMTELVSAVE